MCTPARSRILAGQRAAALAFSLVFPLAALAGCDSNSEDDGHGHDEETEVISVVQLSFTPVDGGDTIVAAFTDPDGDGGVSGTADPISLALGTEYELSITLLNELEDPPIDITEEIREEAEDHFFFVLGEGVSGPGASSSPTLVSHAYADLESDYGENLVGDDLPVGIVNTITADAAGTGTLRVMLRHLPALNDSPQKRGDLPQTLAEGGALPGEVDVDVSFELTVL